MARVISRWDNGKGTEVIRYEPYLLPILVLKSVTENIYI